MQILSVLDFGAVGDGVTDDLPAFNAARDAVKARGGWLWVPPLSYALYGTWSLDHCHGLNLLAARGGQVDGTPAPGAGAVLRYFGPAGGTAVSLFGVQYATVSGLTVDGRGVAGTGVLIDSDNNPCTRQVRLTDVGVYNAAVGVQVGTGSQFQIDGWDLSLTIANCPTGVALNSGNAGQYSRLAARITGYRWGILLLRAGGALQIGPAAGGGCLAPPGDPTQGAFFDVAGPRGEVTLTGVQVEGTGLGVRVRAEAGPDTAHAITLDGSCHFDVPSEVRAVARVVSTGTTHNAEFRLLAAGAAYTDNGDTVMSGGVVCGVPGTQRLRVVPNTVAPFVEFETRGEGQALRLTMLGAVNPSLELANPGAGGGTWQLVVPAAGGLLPGGLVVYNPVTHRQALRVYPDATDANLELGNGYARFGGTLYVGTTGACWFSENRAGWLRASARMNWAVEHYYDDGANANLGYGTGTVWGTSPYQCQAWWGARPIPQPVLPLGSDTNTIIATLQRLGLCRQA